MEKSNNKSSGIGFSGVLTCVFIALKLMGYISWKWIWILSPMWITWGFAVFRLALVGVVMYIKGEL